MGELTIVWVWTEVRALKKTLISRSEPSTFRISTGLKRASYHSQKIKSHLCILAKLAKPDMNLTSSLPF